MELEKIKSADYMSQEYRQSKIITRGDGSRSDFWGKTKIKEKEKALIMSSSYFRQLLNL